MLKILYFRITEHLWKIEKNSKLVSSRSFVRKMSLKRDGVFIFIREFNMSAYKIVFLLKTTGV